MLPYFLEEDALGSSAVFPASALDSAISLKSTGSFNRGTRECAHQAISLSSDNPTIFQ